MSPKVDLRSLKYNELRKLAKSYGITSKSKIDILNGIARASIAPNADLPETPRQEIKLSTPVSRKKSSKSILENAPTPLVSSVRQSARRRTKNLPAITSPLQNNGPNTLKETKNEASPPPAKIRGLSQVMEEGIPVTPLPRVSSLRSGLGATPPTTASRRTRRGRTRQHTPNQRLAQSNDPELLAKITPLKEDNPSTPMILRSTRKLGLNSTPHPISKSSRRKSLHHTAALSPIPSPATPVYDNKIQPTAAQEAKPASQRKGRRSELGSMPVPFPPSTSRRRARTAVLSPIPSPGTLSRKPEPQKPSVKGSPSEQEEVFFSFKSSSTPKGSSSKKQSTPKRKSSNGKWSLKSMVDNDTPSSQPSPGPGPSSRGSSGSRKPLVQKSLSPIAKVGCSSEDVTEEAEENKLNSTITLVPVQPEPAEEKENKEVKKVARFSPRLAPVRLKPMVTPNFAKIHSRNFEKMESLDQYVDRKKKRTKIPKLVPVKRVMQVPPTFVPSVLNTSQITTNFTGMNKPRNKKKAPVFKFESSTTPSANTSLLNSSFHKRMTFDLQASLNKKLKYQPHRGKLKSVVNKPQVQVLKRREESREMLRGVRTNRRFDLIMKKRPI